MSKWIDLNALWKIIVIGLICGAGLPALFAVGLRGLALPPSGGSRRSASEDRVYAGNPVGLLLAVTCFTVVLAAIGWGIYVIVHSS
jgi:hypothetical protein